MNGFLAEVTSNRVAAHRQRQTAGVLVPPLAEIEHFMQPEIVIEKLAFMNQQAGVAAAFGHRFDDLIEGNDLVLKIWGEETERQKRAGQGPRYRDPEIHQVSRIEFPIGHDYRAIVVANRCAM